MVPDPTLNLIKPPKTKTRRIKKKIILELYVYVQAHPSGVKVLPKRMPTG